MIKTLFNPHRLTARQIVIARGNKDLKFKVGFRNILMQHIINTYYITLFILFSSLNYFQSEQHIFTIVFLLKGVETLPQVQIFYSLYLCNPITETFDISNYEICEIK